MNSKRRELQTTKPKDVKSNGNRAITEFIEKIPVNFSTRRELNFFGKLLIIGCYTIACIFLTGEYFFGDSSENIERLESAINKNQRMLIHLGKSSNGVNDIDRVIETNKIFAENIEGTLSKVVEEKYGAHDKIIQKQRERIALLEKRLKRLLAHRSLLDSEARGKREGKSIPYSNKNLSVLKYEQNLKMKRFKEKQKSDADAFIAINDMNGPEGEVKWKRFQDRQRLERYELKQGYFEENEKFRRNRYRVIGNSPKVTGIDQ